MLKVLIADDEVIERKYLTNLFQKHTDNFQLVGTAKNGNEVVSLTQKHRPHVIIMDINMPCLNGLDSAHMIKNKYPETIIILNTAYAEFEFARKAIDYGLDAYLLKPAKESQILDTIQNCIAKKSSRLYTHSQYTAEFPTELPINASDAISKVQEYITINFHRNLTLEELAALAHFSPSYLSRLFHQMTGYTIKNYLTLKRLEHAKYLLCNTQLNIHEISFKCGFTNVSHFNRVFKNQTNLSPLEYRKQTF